MKSLDFRLRSCELRKPSYPKAMTQSPIQWDPEPKLLAADPAASLALDGSSWQRIGAHFRPVDDGNGEEPGLATASVETPIGTVFIAVLDYGAEITYLLVPGVEPDRFAATAAVLEAFEAAGLLSLQTDLLDLAGSESPSTKPSRQPPQSADSHIVVRVKVRRPHGVEVAKKRRGLKATTYIKDEPIFGTVKWFREDKRFGFVTPDQGDDIFVHHVDPSGRALTQGARVKFDVPTDEMGHARVFFLDDVPLGRGHHLGRRPRARKSKS
jgi:CspA family cold shock protein